MNIHIGVLLLGAMSTGSLVACVAPVPPKLASASATPAPATLAAYGEQVFRLQNSVMDDLIDAESADPAPSASESAILTSAQREIIDSCQALNEAAQLQMEGHKPGWRLKTRIAASLSRCNASVHAVQAQRAASRGLVEVAIP